MVAAPSALRQHEERRLSGQQMHCIRQGSAMQRRSRSAARGRAGITSRDCPQILTNRVPGTGGGGGPATRDMRNRHGPPAPVDHQLYASPEVGSASSPRTSPSLIFVLLKNRSQRLNRQCHKTNVTRPAFLSEKWMLDQAQCFSACMELLHQALGGRRTKVALSV